MTPQPPDLNALLAPLKTRAVDDAAVARQRAGFLRKAHGPKPRRALGWAFAALVPLAAAAVVAAQRRAPKAVTATVDLRPALVGQWISAPDARSLPLRFSDGSALLMHPGARLRLTALTAHGATVVVEDGSVDVRVRHRADTAWRLTAGPYAVDVTGTAFTLAWRSREGAIDLAMREGAVRVHGPRMGDGVAVRDREQVHARVESSALAINTPIESDVPAATEVEIPRDDAGLAEARPRVIRPRRAHAVEAIAEDAAVALEAADVAAAEVDAGAAEETAVTMMDDADHSRRDGQYERSRRLMVQVRQRFAGSEQAHRAAYLLGLIALTESEAPSTAAHWFEQYLREAPHGPLASDAEGRLMQALEQAGDHDGARAAAERYLARDAGTVFRDQAQSLLR